MQLQVLSQIRPLKLVLAGDSAGGNLALASAMMLLHSRFTQHDSRHLCAHSALPQLSQETSDLLDMAACFQLASIAFSAASPSSASSMSYNSGPSSTHRTSRLAALLLVYPCLDPSRSGASHATHASSPTLTATELMWFWKHYVPAFNSETSDSASALYAVLNAKDDVFRIIPPCFLATAGQDPLRDDGMSLVARLKVGMSNCR